LRISGPLILEQEPLYALMASFPNDYPPVQADLYFTNAFLDPIAENVDVPIRFGALQDSSLVAQRIGTGRCGIRCGDMRADLAASQCPGSRPDDEYRPNSASRLLLQALQQPEQERRHSPLTFDG
jgi:DNA-binding transcriptional LysR family regulator